jgi:hypothetical protein
MIWDIYPEHRIRLFPSRIPNLGVKKALGPVIESATLALHIKNDKVQIKIFCWKEPGASSNTYRYRMSYNQPCISLEKLEMGVLSIQDLRYITSAHTDRTSDNIGFLSCILHS